MSPEPHFAAPHSPLFGEGRLERDRPDSARPVPVPRGSPLSSTRNAHFLKKCRSRLRETGILLSPVCPAALLPTRNHHFQRNVTLTHA